MYCVYQPRITDTHIYAHILPFIQHYHMNEEEIPLSLSFFPILYCVLVDAHTHTHHHFLFLSLQNVYKRRRVFLVPVIIQSMPH